ncbi:uncharacterized protein Hap1MRO34_011580 isoform 2-T2 [Clarias gariepinus]
MINPVILLMTLSCLREPCFEKNDCHVRYGEMLTPKLARCIEESCKEALQPCALQTISYIITEMKSKDPSASTQTLLHQAADVVLKDLQSFLICLRKITEGPIEAITCALEALLGDSQQHGNNKKPPSTSSSRDFYSYMFCWIKTFIDRIDMNCLSHYDVDTLKTLVKHLAINQVAQDCYVNLFPHWGKKCIPASMQFFGNGTARKITDRWKEYEDCVTALNDMWKKCVPTRKPQLSLKTCTSAALMR